MTRSAIALAVLLFTSSALAQGAGAPPREELRGLWGDKDEGGTPLLLVKDPRGPGYGGIVQRDGRLYHLLVREQRDRWYVRVRGEEERGPATKGGLLALGERRARGEAAPNWTWEAPRTYALRDDGKRLRAATPNGELVLQHPLRGPAASTASWDDLPESDLIVIGHRGSPIEHVENTLPSLQAAVDAGATGIEMDLCFTRDGEVVVWHDASPDSLVALIRNHGFEGGMGYMPIFPGLGSKYRRPVHELDLVDLRAHYGYSKRRFTLTTLDPDPQHRIPTFEEAAPILAASSLRMVLLDVKLPPDAPELHAAFARKVSEIVERHGLADRVVWMHVDSGVIGNLDAASSGRYRATHDVEIKKLFPLGDPTEYSAVSAALRMGNQVASVGRPRLMLWGGWDYYLQVLQHDRARIDAEDLNLDLVAWTLNDPGEIGEVLRVGVEGVVTDHPGRLAHAVRR